MTNKYVHKKWASEDWNNDPAWLFENKPKKFAKYIKYYQEKCGEQADENVKPAKKAKKIKDDSSDDDMEMNHMTKKVKNTGFVSKA